jgi:hypothetical protein
MFTGNPSLTLLDYMLQSGWLCLLMFKRLDTCLTVLYGYTNRGGLNPTRSTIEQVKGIVEALNNVASYNTGIQRILADFQARFAVSSGE